jgi:hypothetical protein
MPCNASYARFILEGFSYARQIDMQPICTSMLVKKFILVKSGCYIHPAPSASHARRDGASHIPAPLLEPPHAPLGSSPIASGGPHAHPVTDEGLCAGQTGSWRRSLGRGNDTRWHPCGRE